MTPKDLDRFPPLLDAITKRVNDAASVLEGADIDDARTAVAAAWDLLGEVERQRPVVEAAQELRELLRYPPGPSSRPLAPILRAEAALIDALDAAEPSGTEAGRG